MQLIVETFIEAPPSMVFDMARDIGLHCRTLCETGERAVAGVTSGRIGLGESVTFEGSHLGVVQRLSLRVVEFEAPQRFVREMTDGPFKAMRHLHEFESCDGGTLMRETLTWTASWGPLGTLADILAMRPHWRHLLRRRGARLKALAEQERTRTVEFRFARSAARLRGMDYGKN